MVALSLAALNSMYLQVTHETRRRVAPRLHNASSTTAAQAGPLAGAGAVNLRRVREQILGDSGDDEQHTGLPARGVAQQRNVGLSGRDDDGEFVGFEHLEELLR